MLKKILCMASFLIVLCMCSVSLAKNYERNHPFFTWVFWKEANVEDVRKNLKDGYDINSVNVGETSTEGMSSAGYNVLAVATFYGAKVEVLEELLKNGARVTGDAMYFATDLAKAKLFVKYGGDVNALNPDNNTVLNNIRLDDMDVTTLQWFLEQGALADIKNFDGYSPLSYFPNWKKDLSRAKVNLLVKAGVTSGKGRWPHEAGLPRYTVQKNTLKTYTPTHNYFKRDFWRVATLEEVQQSYIEGEKIPKFPFDVLEFAVMHTQDPAIIDFLMGKGLSAKESFSAALAALNPNSKVYARFLQNIDKEDIESYNRYAIFHIVQAGLLENAKLLFEALPNFAADLNDAYFEKVIEDYQYDLIPTKGRPDKAAVRAYIAKEHAKASKANKNK